MFRTGRQRPSEFAMSTLSSILDKTATFLLRLAALFICLMMLHVAADVVSKLLFRHPLLGTLETVSLYYMVAVVFFPLGAVQRERTHIFIELFTHTLPERIQRLLDAIALLLGFLITAILFWKGLEVAIDKTAVRELSNNITWQYEVWPGRWFPVAGFAIAAAYCLVQFLAELKFVITGHNGQPKALTGHLEDE